ncbi:DUF1146 family protein [Streptococcus sp. H31]|uniref:DUF1146 family protein n=1 Tax=Streptococcus huangxiaojuni TaxID=3237239 RepID=UPI0034A36352
MEIINNIIALASHLFFTILFFQLLTSVFDWHKAIKMTPENIRRLRLFVILLSAALGYLVSHLMLEVIEISQNLFFILQ